MKGNVLVIGNSGVGKSTLINAVLGEDRAVTGYGTEGTTKKLAIYENRELPFRVIDSVGFEPSFWKEQRAIRAIKRWSEGSAKEPSQEDRRINAIWFCIDGTSRKLFPQTIKNLSRATSMWESVPVIAVITKSYSVPERKENIEMVNNAFAKQKRYSSNLRGVIPVVAALYPLNDCAYAPPEGITELIDTTANLLPEGIKASELDINRFKLNRKRTFAHSVVGAATLSALTIGAVPIPFPDTAILAPVELGEIKTVAKIYGINQDEKSKQFIQSIVEVGAISLVAKNIINVLKSIPGINIGAALLNAIVAGSIVAAIGEGSIYAFEQIYLGNKTIEDIDWVKKLIESKLSSQFIENTVSTIKNLVNTSDKETILKTILNTYNK